MQEDNLLIQPLPEDNEVKLVLKGKHITQVGLPSYSTVLQFREIFELTAIELN